MKNFWKSLGDKIDLVVLLTCLLITYLVWSYGIHNDKTEVNNLDDKSYEVTSVLSNEIGDIESFLDGVGGLYSASNEVSPRELSQYMISTSANKLNGEMLRINFVKAESSPDQTKFLVSQVVDKAGVQYPASELDLASDPNRKLLVEQLLSGQKFSIVAVPSVLGVPEYGGEGLIVGVPVYKDQQLIGMVTGVISQDKLNQMVEKILNDKYGWKWTQNDKVLGERINDAPNTILADSEVVVIPGIKWRFEVSTQKMPSLVWNFILGAGIIMSFLIYSVVYALSSANYRGEELARQTTLDLQKYKLALDSASNHIIITDDNGVVIYANAAAEQTTGFPREEMLGKTPRLWGKQMPPQFYVDFWDQIKKDKKVFTGVFTNKRKNGELYQAQGTVSPIVDKGGTLVGFVGVEEDVTQELAIQKENAESLARIAKFNKIMIGRELKMVELKKALQKAGENSDGK